MHCERGQNENQRRLPVCATSHGLFGDRRRVISLAALSACPKKSDNGDKRLAWSALAGLAVYRSTVGESLFLIWIVGSLLLAPVPQGPRDNPIVEWALKGREQPLNALFWPSVAFTLYEGPLPQTSFDAVGVQLTLLLD